MPYRVVLLYIVFFSVIGFVAYHTSAWALLALVFLPTYKHGDLDG